MVTEALRRLMRERKAREDEAFAEREALRLAEVRDAFFEGMAAGNDQLWHERPAEDYWLESATRRRLYHGPPLPADPHARLRAGRGRRGYHYDPQRDPGQVVGRSFWPSPKKRPGRGKSRK